jgi:hypothetical protein
MKPTSCSVLAEGTWVTLPNGCEGRIMGVMLKGGHVNYLVVWWQDEEREEEWLYDHECVPVGPDPLSVTIGFHHHSPQSPQVDYRDG